MKLFPNLLLILLFNNPTTCLSAISECISNYKCISEQPEVGWRSTKIAEKISGLCQHYQRWIYCWLEGFIPGLMNLQLFANKLIKWLSGECAAWFFDNIMTWSYCLHRRYSTSRQKNNILINEHALNHEPELFRQILCLCHPQSLTNAYGKCHGFIYFVPDGTIFKGTVDKICRR